MFIIRQCSIDYRALVQTDGTAAQLSAVTETDVTVAQFPAKSHILTSQQQSTSQHSSRRNRTDGRHSSIVPSEITQTDVTAAQFPAKSQTQIKAAQFSSEIAEINVTAAVFQVKSQGLTDVTAAGFQILRLMSLLQVFREKSPRLTSQQQVFREIIVSDVTAASFPCEVAETGVIAAGFPRSRRD